MDWGGGPSEVGEDALPRGRTRQIRDGFASERERDRPSLSGGGPSLPECDSLLTADRPPHAESRPSRLANHPSLPADRSSRSERRPRARRIIPHPRAEMR